MKRPQNGDPFIYIPADPGYGPDRRRTPRRFRRRRRARARGRALSAAALFGFDESVARPIRLLAAEPLAWIVIAALLVAVVGHAFIE